MVKSIIFTVIALISTNSHAALSDPTRPSLPNNLITPEPATKTEENASQKAADSLKLQSILFSPHRSVAIINGKGWRLGDNVEGFKLTQIEQTRVILQNENNATFILKLYERTPSQKNAQTQ